MMPSTHAPVKGWLTGGPKDIAGSAFRAKPLQARPGPNEDRAFLLAALILSFRLRLNREQYEFGIQLVEFVRP